VRGEPAAGRRRVRLVFEGGKGIYIRAAILGNPTC
jgi:hypothetical protein